MTHKEFFTGINGDGTPVYMVVTVEDSTGQWLHTERFDNKAEARSELETNA